MKWFNNMKVAVKISLICTTFIIICMIISLGSLRNSNNSNEAFNVFYNDIFKSSNRLNLIMKDILQIRINMMQQQLSAINNDWDDVEKRKANSKELTADYQKNWEEFLKTVNNPEEKKLTDKWLEQRNIAAGKRDLFVPALEAKDFKMSQKYLFEWMVEFEKLKITTDELIKIQQDNSEKLIAGQLSEARKSMIINLAIMIISIILGVILTVSLARAITKPVNKGLHFAKKLASGDLTERIELDQKDELGVLGNALNTTADNLEKLISEIVVATQNLNQAVREIAEGNENLSQRTSEQASSLEEISSTIEEAASSISQNAENSLKANELSRATTETSNEGNIIVQEAVNAIMEISDASKKIGEIIGVINDISFQTNLLALNAAVEAARAGEQGRGFAVVAGEVRNLAQRSGNAAKEIAGLIKDSIEKVNRGTSLASKSGDALKNITDSIKELARYIAEISAASEEQKQGISQINISVTELDTMTQQNAGLVEETASASEEMANQAQELLKMMENFKIRAEINEPVKAMKHKEIHLKSTSLKNTQKNEQKKKPANTKFIVQKSAVQQNKRIEDVLSSDGFEEF